MIETEPAITWSFIGRVIIKAAVLFALCNLLFAASSPMESVGRVSLYNNLLPGRERLPYGENPAESYNLSLFNVPAMLSSHTISRPKMAAEFRVVVLGDSAVWGWYLENADTLTGQINAQNHTLADGRRLVAYNLGYPIMSLTKDLMLLQAVLPYEPDLIVWLVTLESLPRTSQLAPPLLQHNPARVRALIADYALDLDPNDARFVEPRWVDKTWVGQRRPLADWLRLQLYGFSWAATGIDQAIPAEIPLRRADFEEDVTWQSWSEPTPLTTEDLAFDVLQAGISMSGDRPLLLVNEPMFISNGRNSHLRYNSLYPRWAYDAYREELAATAAGHNWHYLELWDPINRDEFTDSPVHLTPAGSAQLARWVAAAILALSNPE